MEQPSLRAGLPCPARAPDQLDETKMDKCPYLTTAAGTPVTDNRNSQTAGPRGPVLMQDYQLMEKMARLQLADLGGAGEGLLYLP